MCNDLQYISDANPVRILVNLTNIFSSAGPIPISLAKINFFTQQIDNYLTIYRLISLSCCQFKTKQHNLDFIS